MSEKHWSESLNDGLSVINQGLEYINPAAWVGKIAAGNTNYVDTALGENGYNEQGNIRRSFTDHLTGITPQALKREQDKQVRRFMEEDDTQLGQRAKDLGLETKTEDGKYKKLRGIDRKVRKGEERTANLPEGVLRSDLNLPQSIATVGEDLLQRKVREAKTRLKNTSAAAAAGIDPSTLNGTAATNEAIRQKEIQNEIDKQNKIDEQYENSEKGKRDRETHDSGLDLNQETIASSRAATNLAAVTQRNNQKLALYDRDVDKYRYDDGKVEAQIERDWQAGRDDAQFAANLETIKLQNAAEMERYEMMLQNDKEVRQGESISDLMSALSMLGGAFML